MTLDAIATGSVEALRVELDAEWKDMLAGSELVRLVESGDFDQRLYALYLIETFHYTRENPRHQALVGVGATADPIYLKFCFKHAAEEMGHEMMALHDLRSIGYQATTENLPEPLEATEVLTAYLYYVAQHGNPLARVGYSFWAESAYEHIGPLLAAGREKLGIDDHNMTFLVAHARIDADHAREVEQVLRRSAVTPDDWRAVARTMRVSLRLTGAMLDAVAREYRAVADGLSDRLARLEG